MFLKSATLGAAAMAASLLMGTPALAHPKLLASTPAANSTVGKPTKIELRFSEKLVAPFTSIDLTGMPIRAGGKATKIGGHTKALSTDGKTLIIKLKAPLAAGVYKLVWRAVSADTHRVTGNYSFKVN